MFKHFTRRHWYGQASVVCWTFSLPALLLIWVSDPVWFLPWGVFMITSAIFFWLDGRRWDHNWQWLTAAIDRGVTSGMTADEAEDFIHFILWQADPIREAA